MNDSIREAFALYAHADRSLDEIYDAFDGNLPEEKHLYDEIDRLVEMKFDAGNLAASSEASDIIGIAMKAWLLRGIVEDDPEDVASALTQSLCPDLARHVGTFAT